jgi:acyl carrier protein
MNASDVVARAWSDLLGASPTRSADDFFRAGGDSLKAVRLVAAIRDLAGVSLPFRVVFDNSTYGELTEAVARACGEAGSAG